MTLYGPDTTPEQDERILAAVRIGFPEATPAQAKQIVDRVVRGAIIKQVRVWELVRAQAMAQQVLDQEIGQIDVIFPDE
jgi:hypothetical protein